MVNDMANTLSRKAKLASISKIQEKLLDLIKEGIGHYVVTMPLLHLAIEGKKKQFWVQDNLLYTKGCRVYVPKWRNLRNNLINECHETNCVSHSG